MACNPTVSFIICCDVGVKQVKRNATDVSLPNLSAHRALANCEFDEQRCTLLVLDQLDWQLRRVRLDIIFFLPTIAPQALSKISVSVKQPDRNQRQAKIARRLQMISGQDSQA